MRIVFVKAIDDESRVIMVLGENNGLSQPVAVRDLQTLGHEPFERLVDGVGIEQPLVEGCGFDLDRNVAVFVPFDSVPRLFLVLSQLVVPNSFG